MPVLLALGALGPLWISGFHFLPAPNSGAPSCGISKTFLGGLGRLAVLLLTIVIPLGLFGSTGPPSGASAAPAVNCGTRLSGLSRVRSGTGAGAGTGFFAATAGFAAGALAL